MPTQADNPTRFRFAVLPLCAGALRLCARTWRRHVGALPLLLLATAGACAPPFSELQSARLAGTHRIELTGSYGTVSFSDDDETEKVQNQYGVQLATGMSDAVDARLRYERITADDGDGALNVLGFGPKVRLLPDRIALYVPVGFAFGEDIDVSETWQIHPTLLATVPVVDMVEVNGSAKLLVPFESDFDTTVAFNLGLGIGNMNRIVVRPEFGFLFNPGEDGHFRHFSIGLTYYAPRR
jgi:hypothetical protein